MEKIQITISGTKTDSFDYFGKTIEVSPIIGIEAMGTIRNAYFSSLFKNGISSEWDEQFAEFMLRVEVLRQQTNIDFSQLKDTDIRLLDIVVWGKLYSDVCSRISNYQEMVGMLNKSVEHEIKRYEIENSAGKIVSGVVEYAKGFLEEYKNVKPEELEKLKTEAFSIINEIKQSPTAQIFDESKKEKKTRKKKEYVQ